MLDRGVPAVVVAIPARDEADDLPSCLEALARQRGGHGRAVGPSDFAVLVFANSCSDATARVARESAARSPLRVAVVEADANRAAVTEAYQFGSQPITPVLDAVTRQTEETFTFLETLTEYNETIADYALRVLRSNVRGGELARALVVIR